MIEVLKALNKWERRQFEYGSVDCCQFAGFIVNEITGRDYLVDFDYNSEDTANKIISANGDLIKTASLVLGPPTKNVTGLRDGCPVIVDLKGLQIMGIKLGLDAVCLLTKGLVRVPVSHALVGWDTYA